MATSKGQHPGKPSLSKQAEQTIEQRRSELLDRIRQVDPGLLQELTLRVGDPRPAAEEDSFHKYFFKAPGGFTESWRNAAEVVEPLPE